MNSSSTQSADVRTKSTPAHHTCKICGTRALHSNFGAITCGACKVFFRRQAIKGQVSENSTLICAFFHVLIFHRKSLNVIGMEIVRSISTHVIHVQLVDLRNASTMECKSN